MTDPDKKTIKYTIWNPTGNITALVENCEEIARQPEIADVIMQRHSDVEQVGFIRFSDGQDPETPVSLRMAGGEFCGNASMCAAAMYLLRKGRKGYPDKKPETVMLTVSGTDAAVRVDLQETSNCSFSASIELPGSVHIGYRKLSYDSIHAELPLVKMEGILHYVIEAASPFFALKNRKSDAENAVVGWCREEDPCVGLMFLDCSKDQPELTPLVYVPASHTLFWENSCASGSAAVGMYLAAKNGRSSNILLNEPGGMLRVMSDPAGKTVLTGNAKMEGSFTL